MGDLRDLSSTQAISSAPVNNPNTNMACLPNPHNQQGVTADFHMSNIMSNDERDNFHNAIFTAPVLDFDGLGLEIVRRRQNHQHRIGDVFFLKGGNGLINQEMNSENYKMSQTNDAAFFTERGEPMTFDMYKKRWKQLECQRDDPLTNELPLVGFVNLKGSVLSELKSYINNLVEKKLLIPTPARNEQYNDFEYSHFADLIFQIEGCHVTQSRLIGDIRTPLYISFASMLWLVQGYSRLSRRMTSELNSLIMEIESIISKELFFKLIEQNRCNIAIGRCLEAQMAFTSIRHQQVTKKQLELAMTFYAEELHCLKGELRRVKI